MNVEYNNQHVDYMNKTKEEVQNEVFANAIPFDKEAFQVIVEMYYDTFKDLVNR